MKDEIKEIKLWKEKTKGIFHITEYTRFWNYITNLQQENENNKKAINLFKDDLANMTYQYAKEKEENEKLKKRNEEIYKGYMSVVDELTEYAEENERLKQANKILEENWKHYMMRCGKALDYVNNTSNFRLITLQNILQNGSEKDE